MTREHLIRQLAQLEARAQLLQGSIAELRQTLQELQPPPPPQEEVDGQCQHLETEPAPSMGHPSRRFCVRCHQVVE